MEPLSLFKKTVYFLLGKYKHLTKRAANFFFDLCYGLDTRHHVSIEVLGTDPTLCYGYEATDWISFKSVLKRLDIKSTDTFLDLGSGKGRALLIASEFPFRKIIGVEISKELCDLARKNVERYLQRKKAQCGHIEIVNANAFTYRVPSEVSVLYLADPFPGKTLDRVLNNLVGLVKIDLRRVLVIYGGSQFCGKFTAFSNIKELPSVSGYQFYKIYEFSPNPAVCVL